MRNLPAARRQLFRAGPWSPASSNSQRGASPSGTVIASRAATKQSFEYGQGLKDCFVAALLAMTRDPGIADAPRSSQ